MTLRKALFLISASALAFSSPAFAQMDHSNMPGMNMPGMKMPPKPAAPRKAQAKPARKGAPAKPHQRARTQKKAPAAARAPVRTRPPVRRAGAAARAAASSPAMAGHDLSTMQMPSQNSPGTSLCPPQMPGMPMPVAGAPAQGMANMPGMPTSQSGAAPGHNMAAMQMPPGTSPQGHDISQMPGMATPEGSAAQTHNMANMPGMQTSQTPAAQDHNMANMPGMKMPQASASSAHNMANMPGMPMAQPAVSPSQCPPQQVGAPAQNATVPIDQEQAGTNLAAGTGTPPPLPTDWAADNVYPTMAMAHARAHGVQMHGGKSFNQVMLDLAEYQVRDGRDGFNWDANAWFGGDIDRLWLKSEGEGDFGKGGGVERAEVQALFSHAIDPYFNLQAGVRHDFEPHPSRTYLTVGIEGLAPSFFEVEGFLFLSNKGDLHARLAGYYDQRITQRLILQPRIEVNFAAQDVPEIAVGSGLSDAELGLRLRYDIRREFAPYVGVEYQRAFGNTATYRRAAGESSGGWNFVLGLRTWL